MILMGERVICGALMSFG